MSADARPQPDVLRSRDPDELAKRVARTLISRIVAIQRTERVPSVVLTGGTIALRIHSAVAASDDRDLVDWSRVDFWFGDERFVASGCPDRNAGQAQRAMLGPLEVDPARVHVMPGSDGPHGNNVDAAAAAYADELADYIEDNGDPAFDVLMLGIGPDGHCASLFPGRTEQLDERLAVAVRDAPKPPPTRISLTMRALSRSREVWWVAAGEAKAQAVSRALAGADPVEVPAAGPRGLEGTLWFLDTEAASQAT